MARGNLHKLHGNLWRDGGVCIGESLERRCLLSANLTVDLNPGTASSAPSEMVALNSSILLFAATSPSGEVGRELYRSDGTSGGTYLVKDIRTGSIGSSPLHLVNMNGIVYFQASDLSAGSELWRSDGTEPGTYRVKDCIPGAASSQPDSLTGVNGTLYFVAQHSGGGYDLWRSDGTDVGTVVVKFFDSTARPGKLVNNNGTLLFTSASDKELWKSDGSSAGTVKIKDVDIRSEMVPMNGTVYFAAYQDATGIEPWISQGTTATTIMLREIRTGAASTSPAEFTVSGGKVYFSASDGFAGQELWSSDGSEMGTALFADINPGPVSSSPQSFVAFDGGIAFQADDGAHGIEPWASDLTAGGTHLVRDIYAGGWNSSPQKLTASGGWFYFTAFDSATGTELWQSDGTLAGTNQTADIHAGSASSSANYLTRVGNSLFLQANDGITGQELWFVPPDATSQVVAVGAGYGATPLVKVLDADTHRQIWAFNAYATGFLGGVRVAAGDLTGDGTPDIIVGTGVGAAHVKVFDPTTKLQIPGPLGSFLVYPGPGNTPEDPNSDYYRLAFKGGIYVASGDVDGDGRDDLITAADAGAGPHIKVFSGATGQAIRSFWAFAQGFQAGVRIAAGDIDGDGYDDILAGTGSGACHVKVFSGQTGAELRSYLVYPGPGNTPEDPNSDYYRLQFKGGVFVASGDVNADGRDDIITGADSGAGPHVKALSGQNGATLASFWAFDQSFGGGVRVACTDSNADGRADIFAGTGSGASHVRIFNLVNSSDPPLLEDFIAYDAQTAGVYTAASY